MKNFKEERVLSLLQTLLRLRITKSGKLTTFGTLLEK